MQNPAPPPALTWVSSPRLLLPPQSAEVRRIPDDATASERLQARRCDARRLSVPPGKAAVMGCPCQRKSRTRHQRRERPRVRQSRDRRRRRPSVAATAPPRRPAFPREQGGVNLRLASLRALLRRLTREQGGVPWFARPAGQTGVRRQRRVSMTEQGSGAALTERASRPPCRAKGVRVDCRADPCFRKLQVSAPRALLSMKRGTPRRSSSATGDRRSRRAPLVAKTRDATAVLRRRRFPSCERDAGQTRGTSWAIQSRESGSRPPAV